MSEFFIVQKHEWFLQPCSFEFDINMYVVDDVYIGFLIAPVYISDVVTDSTKAIPIIHTFSFKYINNSFISISSIWFPPLFDCV